MHKNKSMQRLISSRPWHGEISSNVTFAYNMVYRCGSAARLTADSCQEFIDEPEPFYRAFLSFFFTKIRREVDKSLRKLGDKGRYT